MFQNKISLTGSARHEASNPHEALHLVTEGLGVAIAPASVLSDSSSRAIVRPLASNDFAAETALCFAGDVDPALARSLLQAVTHVRDEFLRSPRAPLQISA